MYFVLFIFIAYIGFEIYIYSYFNSDNFKQLKSSIQSHIDKCNKLNHHIEELKCSFVNIKSYNYGESYLRDTSNYKFKRNEWNKNIKNNYIYNCSLTVCQNANKHPFKYLCKYFNIQINEETLNSFENLLNNFSAAEDGKFLLKKERDLILNNIKNSIPTFIFMFKNKLIKKLGFEYIDLRELYFPSYRFQYVSPGGNSSMKCDIKLNIKNLNAFINYLNDLIKFKKSAKGQRSLMTSKLREKIKFRDNYKCQICGLSVIDEKYLLLEIDHIIPISKGGITSENNLQTLCWMCNRSKGSK
jgi:hypothetical protein